MDISEAKKIPHSKLFKILDKMREDLKKDKVVQDIFDKYDLDIEELDYIPMCFADLDVSARTEKGIIYFNYKLLTDGDFKQHYHYAAHEIVHAIQQTTGDSPTPGFTDDDYLDTKEEQEGFNTQTQFITNNHGKDKAKDYIERVLDHHDIAGKKRDKLKKKILNTKQASLLSTEMRNFVLDLQSKKY